MLSAIRVPPAFAVWGESSGAPGLRTGTCVGKCAFFQLYSYQATRLGKEGVLKVGLHTPKSQGWPGAERRQGWTSPSWSRTPMLYRRKVILMAEMV